MQSVPENTASTGPAEHPLFSTGKKIVFVGGLLVAVGFFLPWFHSITAGMSTLQLPSGEVISVPNVIEHPSGAEIPHYLGWIVFGMAFLVVILPDSFPELGTVWLRMISLVALAVGAAALAWLLFKHPIAFHSSDPGANSRDVALEVLATNCGVLFNALGYVLLLVGALMDLATLDASARR